MEELLPLSFQIVRFKLFAAVRKSARRGEGHAVPAEQANLMSGNPGPEAELLQSERRRVLLVALRNLGTRCRELLRMKLEGHSFEAIRAHFGAASINTVYTWDLRCRRQLIDALAVLGEAVR
jgi:RNA polymerase sigma-70 factor (ECF subfamily)